MSRYKIIDVFSSFFCCDPFQQDSGGSNESNEGDFFTGYADAEKYVSMDFACPLNRPVVVPTGINERLVDNHDKKESQPGEII